MVSENMISGVLEPPLPDSESSALPHSDSTRKYSTTISSLG
jgi:hypothetical protein